MSDKNSILIVEDDPINRKLFGDVLRANGYQVIEATSGREGLEKARSEKPHLILMDIQLPEMDGMETVGVLKSEPETQKIPAMALTGYAIQGDRERIMASGFDDYMSKPVDLDQLLEKVRGWCASPSVQASSESP